MVDRTEIFPYRRLKRAFSSDNIESKVDKLSALKIIIRSSQLRFSMLYSVIGFLLGRAVILDYLSPFGLAFLSAAILHETNTGLTAVSILLGVLSIGQKELLLKYILSTLLVVVFYILTHRIRINKKILISVLAALSNFAAGYFIFYIKDYFVYDLFMVIIESVLIGVFIYVYDTSMPLLKKIHKRKILSSEEIISLSILIAFCFVGADFQIMGLSVKNIAVILLIMLSSNAGSAGTGAAMGIIFGIIQALSGSILPTTIGVYGLCGMLCGILKGIGKIGCPIGFIMGNALMTFYINGSTEVLIKFYEILAASIIFMIMPKSIVKNMFSFKTIFTSEYSKEASLNRRMKDYTRDKLKEVSEVFSELSATIKESINSTDYFSQADAAKILDQVVSQCCTSCGMCSSCWKRDFYKSYQNLFNMLSTIENEGEANVKAMVESMKGKCMKSEELVMSLKHNYDLFRSSLNWKKKINESRLVVSDQLREVSSVVSNLALQVNMNVNFNKELEELILVALDNEGIAVEDVIVAQTGGIFEVDIRVPACGGKRRCVRDFVPIINKAANKKFVKTNSLCNLSQNNLCSIKLREAQKFQIATGIARENKSGAVSGDNYTYAELKDGKYMLALSDGMGSGPKADLESYTTIRLLEKFLMAGFDKDVTVRTINSLLLMKSNEDSYATIDMTVINQYNGEVEFVKVGAVSTFIKYKDRVDIIKVGSLPVGILNNIDMEFIRRKLGDGDFLVMVTDGILDCNKDQIDKEVWLADMIHNINTRNPQKMADDIMKKCIDYNDGFVDDDMTIMVAKIWETM